MVPLNRAVWPSTAAPSGRAAAIVTDVPVDIVRLVSYTARTR